ncbi:MAG: glycosyltransferase [Pirellulales bacterium]
MKSLIKQLDVADCVHWTGFTKDIPSAVRRLDALVLPSLFGEGMPMVVLEVCIGCRCTRRGTSVEGTPEVRYGVEGLACRAAVQRVWLNR